MQLGMELGYELRSRGLWAYIFKMSYIFQNEEPTGWESPLTQPSSAWSSPWPAWFLKHLCYYGGRCRNRDMSRWTLFHPLKCLRLFSTDSLSLCVLLCCSHSWHYQTSWVHPMQVSGREMNQGCRTKWSLAKPRLILWFPGKIIIWVPVPYFLPPVPVQQCSSVLHRHKNLHLGVELIHLDSQPHGVSRPSQSQSIRLLGVCFQKRFHCLIPPCKHLSQFYLAHFGYIPLGLAPTNPVGSGQCVCMNDSCSTTVTS